MSSDDKYDPFSFTGDLVRVQKSVVVELSDSNIENINCTPVVLRRVMGTANSRRSRTLYRTSLDDDDEEFREQQRTKKVNIDVVSDSSCDSLLDADVVLVPVQFKAVDISMPLVEIEIGSSSGSSDSDNSTTEDEESVLDGCCNGRVKTTESLSVVLLEPKTMTELGIALQRGKIHSKAAKCLLRRVLFQYGSVGDQEPSTEALPCSSASLLLSKPFDPPIALTLSTEDRKQPDFLFHENMRVHSEALVRSIPLTKLLCLSVQECINLGADPFFQDIDQFSMISLIQQGYTYCASMPTVPYSPTYNGYNDNAKGVGRDTIGQSNTLTTSTVLGVLTICRSAVSNVHRHAAYTCSLGHYCNFSLLDLAVAFGQWDCVGLLLELNIFPYNTEYPMASYNIVQRNGKLKESSLVHLKTSVSTMQSSHVPPVDEYDLGNLDCVTKPLLHLRKRKSTGMQECTLSTKESVPPTGAMVLQDGNPPFVVQFVGQAAAISRFSLQQVFSRLKVRHNAAQAYSFAYTCQRWARQCVTSATAAPRAIVPQWRQQQMQDSQVYALQPHFTFPLDSVCAGPELELTELRAVQAHGGSLHAFGNIDRCARYACYHLNDSSKLTALSLHPAVTASGAESDSDSLAEIYRLHNHATSREFDDTPLLVAIQLGCYPSVVEILLNTPNNPLLCFANDDQYRTRFLTLAQYLQHRGTLGMSALGLAVYLHKTHYVRLLCVYTEVNPLEILNDLTNDSILHFAITNNLLDISQHLLNHLEIYQKISSEDLL